MNQLDVVKKILGERYLSSQLPSHGATSATAFAPSNIALCKYWGKRNTEINLPVTSSLSISLGNFGAEVTLTANDVDQVFLNEKECPPKINFLCAYLNF